MVWGFPPRAREGGAWEIGFFSRGWGFLFRIILNNFWRFVSVGGVGILW